MIRPDATHDPGLSSFVDSARPGHDFPIQNLPYGVFRLAGAQPRIGVAIGDLILDLREVAEREMLAGLGDAVDQACRADILNDLMALGPEAWTRLRVRLSQLLSAASDRAVAVALRPRHDITLELPARVGDYTDFYASIHHATNVGALFRPEQPLLPNYKWIPIGYHGRSSSLIPSETPVRRPSGQLMEHQATAPRFGPTRALDFECEVGCFIGPGNALGRPIPIEAASRHLFGFCLLNDWSARDIQRWEYQPLGPFLSKSFATSLSPWVVSAEALAPFRVPALPRPEGDPPPLPYLFDRADQAEGGVDLRLEVWLQTEAMRRAGAPAERISAVDFREMYWTPAQMIAHHSSNGCNLRPGDLLASGTVSGSAEGARGCLLELTARGTRPLALPAGESRRFLEDGDEVTLRGSCHREGAVPIGFGECRGRIIG